MEKIGIDVHKVASQRCIRTDEGGFVELRIATTQEAFAKHLRGRARVRVLLEASTESEWVARGLEARVVIDASDGAGEAGQVDRDIRG